MYSDTFFNSLQRVEMAKEIYFWPMHISCNQYLHSAIYAPYVRDFTQDTVGISPSDTSIHKFPEGIFGKCYCKDGDINFELKLLKTYDRF